MKVKTKRPPLQVRTRTPLETIGATRLWGTATLAVVMAAFGIAEAAIRGVDVIRDAMNKKNSTS
jgi:hypothetical protein